MDKRYFVYIATNIRNNVLYTGVTNDLERRMYQHRNKLCPGFTSKYNICKLVYYDVFQNPGEAIRAEKRIKSGSRIKKINLITSLNPTFKDLLEE